LKTLYDLKQAGRQWKGKLEGVMMKLGFEKSEADECLFTLQEVVLMVLEYVDDMGIARRSMTGFVSSTKTRENNSK